MRVHQHYKGRSIVCQASDIPMFIDGLDLLRSQIEAGRDDYDIRDVDHALEALREVPEGANG